jgi:hypothetical protein
MLGRSVVDDCASAITCCCADAHPKKVALRRAARHARTIRSDPLGGKLLRLLSTTEAVRTLPLSPLRLAIRTSCR